MSYRVAIELVSHGRGFVPVGCLPTGSPVPPALFCSLLPEVWLVWFHMYTELWLLLWLAPSRGMRSPGFILSGLPSLLCLNNTTRQLKLSEPGWGPVPSALRLRSPPVLHHLPVQIFNIQRCPQKALSGIVLSLIYAYKNYNKKRCLQEERPR